MKIFKSFCFLLFVTLFNAACDKQDNWIDVAKKGEKNGVGFGSTFADALPIYALPDAGTVTQAIPVYVTGSTSGSAKSVTLTVDSAVLNEYNLANGTDIPQVPAAYFSVPSDLSIAANSNSGSVDGTFDISGMATEGTNFAIGLKLSSSSDYVLVGQEKLVVVITIQNIYDADYTTKGYLVHPSSPRALSDTKHLYTIDANTSQAGLGDLYGSDYYFNFTVDATNKLTEWEAVGATPAAPASGFMNVNNPTGNTTYPGGEYTSVNYNNTYNPDTQGFSMHYGYGVGSAGQTGYSREVFEKWTRK